MKRWNFERDMLLTLGEAPKPIAEKGESLIRIMASGICGSDMHAWHGHDERRRPPLILGHEVAGIVQQGDLAGKMVTMNPMICCQKCTYCQQGRENICANRTMIGMTRPGGFAEYLTIPDQCLLVVDENVTAVTSALSEPVAVCVHAVNLLNRHSHHPHPKKQNIVVIGAGAIGLITALVLLQRGYESVSICDANALRVDTAEKALSDFNAKVINNIENPLQQKSYDLVFDAVGSAKTREISMQVVADGGCIIHLGLQQADGNFDARRATIGEIAFVGAFTYTKQDLKEALHLLSNQSLGNLNWVEVRPFEALQQSFEDIHNGATPAAKIIIENP
jgi:alcohol dehydrogenase